MLSNFTSISLVILIALSSGTALGENGGGSAEILGTLGIAQSIENSCIAVWIEVPENSAIAGIRWYNNDGTIAFPEVLVQSGVPNSPVDLPDAVSVSQDVFGDSEAWSEVVFSQHVGSLSGGLYVIFRIPDDTAATGEGPGGGPAIGFTVAGAGSTGWMSSDGLEWEPLHPNYGFAVDGVFVLGEGDLALKSGGQQGGKDSPAGDFGNNPPPLVLTTAIGAAYPNPFNPQIVLEYSMKDADHVDISVYNVRGHLIKTLVSGTKVQGEHSVVWDGRDKNGAQMASGVYFARFVAGPVLMTRRLVLVQ
jgi:hypothetical protein